MTTTTTRVNAWEIGLAQVAKGLYTKQGTRSEWQVKLTHEKYSWPSMTRRFLWVSYMHYFTTSICSMLYDTFNVPWYYYFHDQASYAHEWHEFFKRIYDENNIKLILLKKKCFASHSSIIVTTTNNVIVATNRIYRTHTPKTTFWACKRLIKRYMSALFDKVGTNGENAWI